MALEILFYSLVSIALLATFLPYISHQYWIFRVCEFLRLQILVFLILLLVATFFSPIAHFTFVRLVQLLLLTGIVNHAIKLVLYVPFKTWMGKEWPSSKNAISLVSFNVLQFNTGYQRFIDLIRKVEPDIFLTVESNKDWEKALGVLDKEYPFQQKIALENTYGMHFYTRLNVVESNVNYFMADDLPSVQVLLKTKEGKTFQFFGIHPPPPSPTEEETSKERDGELLVVGKLVQKSAYPTLVVGDFNNVAWSRSARLFRKISGLVDPRIGRGIFASYHAKYRLFRFPIDLLYHSKSIQIETFKVLENIGSDHLPLYCRFLVSETKTASDENGESLQKDEKEEVNEMIREGVKEQSNRPKQRE